ncbi:MAG: 23S rRNA (adenine(2503)-C(2))-methyltransferase RlmN, partial [Lachnospiraceae bacterium]|nr:23S rRNA (adenine(2503)-C(2))-methyltransferase RlmN [Lachnospiraceae bacterium]
MKTDLKSMTREELRAYMISAGEKAFRADQVYDWMHKRLADDFDQMSNLSRALREKLSREATLTALQMADCRKSAIDGTRKYLFRLEDGNVIESVLMRYRFGNSVCISSQAGCRMGCRFCASTIGGLSRSLYPSEMLDQVYGISRDIGEPISHVVVMGSGEPLDNYDNLVRFLRLITDPLGQNMSVRNITVSTCGLVEKIRSLAEEKLPVTLALSLHASSQEKREELMPIARRYPLEQVLDACRYYFEKTGRRITFEYSLVAGVNDTREDAQQLSALARSLNCHVNLIPINPVEERS